MPLASIPSPGSAAWRLGPLPVRAYALCVTAGILLAVVLASRRYRAGGGRPGVILDVAAWAVPFGPIWVESLRIGAQPHVLGVGTGALGDVAVFLLAVVGLYLTRTRGTPPARTYAKANLVDDSSGDVMSR